MSDFLKKGWHPKGKDGGRESWRGDFKGVNQMAGWVGKGKKPGSDRLEGSGHIARPLSTLKDPSLFGPPPRNVNYHGGAALPNEITPHRGGIGAPLTQEEINASQPVYEEEEETQKSPPPALPYRADRTGLTTSNLPPPPIRRETPNGGPPPAPPRATPGLPPRLPTRQNTAPSPVNPTSPPPQYEPTTTAYTRTPTLSMNQTAMNRLGNAGVSVPSLGIGKKQNMNTEESTPWQEEKSQGGGGQLSELQSRFAKFNKTAPQDQSTTSPTSPSQPPTWAQTQSTFNTAKNLHQDPSKVSLQDAQNAAATVQSGHTQAVAFRAKHSDKFDAAERKANAFNKRYNVTGRLNKFLEDANDNHDQMQQNHQQQPGQTNGQYLPPPPSQQQQQQQQHQSSQAPGLQPPTNTSTYQRSSPPPPIPSPQPQSQNQIQSPISSASPPPPSTITTKAPQQPSATASLTRKPPPPPPPKKPSNLAAPPPVPLGTKPNFN